MKENLTAPVVRFLEENSPRASGFTEGSKISLDKDY